MLALCAISVLLLLFHREMYIFFPLGFFVCMHFNVTPYRARGLGVFQVTTHSFIKYDKPLYEDFTITHYCTMAISPQLTNTDTVQCTHTLRLYPPPNHTIAQWFYHRSYHFIASTRLNITAHFMQQSCIHTQSNGNIFSLFIRSSIHSCTLYIHCE